MPTDATLQYPVLYSFRRCPYAMRARLALLASGLICELREVVLRDKPQALLATSPKGTVPVLVTRDGKVLDESLDIMLWALDQHDPLSWLPSQHDDLDAMLALIARCDGEFKYHLDRYKYPDRYDHCDAFSHRSSAADFLDLLNSHLAVVPYLFGSHATLADMAIAPFVRQFSQTDFTWFSAQPWPQLQDWLAAILESDLFGRVMVQYPQWRPEESDVCLFGT